MIVDEVITGVVVSHNTFDLLKRAYESVRKFHPGMQIIIVDGSNNNNSCREYVKSISYDNTFSILAANNIGHGKGMVLGLEHVKTPFVLFFDSDIEMLKSPVQDMLDMMEDDTFGVGYTEQVDLGGHEWGSRKEHMKEGPMKYLHPYFQLVQVKEYKKYAPYIHHGAPAVNTMLEIYRRGLSNKVIKEFSGLGHSSGKGWTWEGKQREYIRHDTYGTRDVRVKSGKEEIEGVWEPVVDPGEQRIYLTDKKITCVTCTGDRPISFDLCQRWIKNQTLQPTNWIIVDDGKEPLNSKVLPSFAKYIRRIPSNTDPKHTMILNMKEAVKHITGDKIFIMEDDEYYAPDYITNLVILMDKYQMVGIGRSKYYYLPGSTYHNHTNMGHASLAQTAFTKEFMCDFLKVLDGDSFLDIRMWRLMNEKDVTLEETGLQERVTNDKRGFIFNDLNKSLYVGMKGLPGRAGIGAGHRGVGKRDYDGKVLRSWIPKQEDYGRYISFFGIRNNQYQNLDRSPVHGLATLTPIVSLKRQFQPVAPDLRNIMKHISR